MNPHTWGKMLVGLLSAAVIEGAVANAWSSSVAVEAAMRPAPAPVNKASLAQAAPGHHREALRYRALREGLLSNKRSRNLPAGSMVTALDEARRLASLSTTGGAWTSIGPAPISFGPPNPYPQATGRVLALAYAPTVPGTVYLGSADGGVWKTADGGSTWMALTDAMPSLAVGAVSVDPNNSAVVYAGTGEIAVDDYARTARTLYGVGIYKSTTGGQSWTLTGNNVFQQQGISAIGVDATNSNRIYAGVVNKPDELSGRGTAGNLGVALSTDGGLNWTEPAAASGTLGGHNVTDLTIDKAGNLYAAVGTYSLTGPSDPANGIYYSSDHGASWTLASPTASATSVWKLALAPSTANNPRTSQIVYAVAGNFAAAGGKVLGVWRSNNGGATWSQVGTTTSIGDCGGQADYDIYIAVDPGSPDTAYVGLTDIFKTTNAGGTWTNITNVYGNCPKSAPVGAIHPDQHAALFVPGGSTILFGNDGGVYKTTNGGSSFTSAIGNLDLAQFYGGDVSRTTPGTILGGLQDNGAALTTNGGNTWNEAVGGDGFYSAIDFNNVHNMYGELPSGKTYRSMDGGSTWFLTFTNTMASDPSLFATPLVMDPSSPATLYAGHSTFLYKTTDGESTWSAIFSPTATVASPVCGSLATPVDCITAIAAAPNSPNTVYLADPFAHIWVTTDGGTSWASLDGPGPCSTHLSPFFCSPGGVTGLAVDPTNSQIVYATANQFVGAQQYHVFRSIDQGANWTDISTTLPDMPFQSIAVNPVTPTTIYAGADAGVYTSMDSGAHWSVLGSGLANANAYQLVPNHSGTQLTVFTYGRGVWQINLQPTAIYTAVSTLQYHLANSDGTSWMDVDSTSPTPLTLTITPTVNVQAVLYGNADLWTATAGINQDIGIDVNGTTVAWKESGGFAGTFSPNAAMVQTVFPMTAATTYTIKLRWKTNRPAAGATIYAGAGPIGTQYSPTRLTAELVPTGVSSAVSTLQYHLANSDGTSWMDVDSTSPTPLTLTITPTVNVQAVLYGNADLWTATAGINQDIGIDVNGTIVAWKESGGFAGTFSPNAAMVQTVFPMTAATTYTIKLRWKTNRPAAGATIYTGAGPIGTQYSPTRLTAELVPTGVSSAVSTLQYHLANSDGTSWADIDSTSATPLTLTITPSVNVHAVLYGNADLWTATAGINQDIGIDVNGTIVAWKESGGFAGTFSPNAAMVQTVFPMTAATTYTIKVRWKTNRPAAGATIYAGAGPIGTQYSPTRLLIELIPT